MASARICAATSERDRLRLNLARARVLPSRTDRYVVVNAAAQRLDMYEGGRVVDSMRVVVGKQKDNSRTPMMRLVAAGRQPQPLLERAARPRRRADRAVRGQGRPLLPRQAPLRSAVRLERRCDADRPGERSTGRRSPTAARSAGAAAARHRQFAGQGEVQFPQPLWRLPARHARQAAADRGDAAVQRRLHPARGCGAVRHLAVRLRR